MNGNVIKRVWAWIMVACMLFTMVPAFAEETAVEAPVETSAPAAVEETADVIAEEPTETPTEEPTEAPVVPEAPEEEAPADDTEAGEPSGDEQITPEVTPVAPAVYSETVIEPEDDGTDDAKKRSKPLCSGVDHQYAAEFGPGEFVKVEGDCNTRRVVVRKCLVCENLIEVTLDYVHDFQEVRTEPNCTQRGRIAYQCVNPNCNYYIKNHVQLVDETRPVTEFGNPTDHAWTKLVENECREATCTQIGWEVWECQNPNCPGIMYDDDYRADTPDKPAKPAKKRDLIQKLPHVADTTPTHKDATCTKPERNTYLCKYGCGTEVRTEVIVGGQPALQHDFEGQPWKKSDDGKHHYRVCRHYDKDPAKNKCDELVNGEMVEACQFVQYNTVPANCAHGNLTYSKCSVCGQQDVTDDGYIDANAHDWEYFDPKVDMANIRTAKPLDVNGKDFTCEVAKSVRWVCRNPDHTTPYDGGVKPYTRHHIYVPDEDQSLAADCMNTGTLVSVCEYCKEKQTTTVPKDPNNHAWGAPTEKLATCTEDAKTIRTCSHTDRQNPQKKCPEILTLAVAEGTAKGHTFRRTPDGSLNDKDLWAAWPEVQEQTKHKFDPVNGSYPNEYYGYISASCDRAGKKTYKCHDCQATEVVWVDPLPHTPNPAGAVFVPRDCENPDRYVLNCTVCHKPIPDKSGPVENGRPATGHKITSWTHVGGDTTTGTGDQKSQHTGTCANPWCSTYNKKTELRTVTKDCVFKRVTQEATCNSYAKEVWKCEVCGFVATNDQKDLDTTKNPNKHTLVRESYTAPTCKNVGREVFKCTNPNCDYKETQYYPAGCKWAPLSAAIIDSSDLSKIQKNGKYCNKPATCVEAGYHWVVCTNPGCDFAGPGTDNVKLKAELGYRNQHAVKRVTDEPTGEHQYQPMNLVEATCTKDATSSGFKCAVCGDIYSEIPVGPIPGTAKGHLWDNGVESVPATCLAGGKIVKTCTRPDCDGFIDTPGYDNKGATGQTLADAQGKVKAIMEVSTPALPHTPSEKEKFYEADCVNPDRWVIECSKCHLPLETKPLPDGRGPLGHNFNKSNWNYNEDADNNTHGRYCVRCKKNFYVSCLSSETAKATPAYCTRPAGTEYTCYVCGHTRFVADAGSTADATKHEWEIRPYNNYGSTCDTVGIGIYVCKFCGKRDTTRPYVAMEPAHQWNDGVITTDATCETDGVRTLTCRKCGKTTTETIRAYGHAWDNGIPTKEPTCTAPGEITKTCQICAQTKVEETAPIAHTFVLNATDDNNIATINYCSLCGEIEFVSWNAGTPAEQRKCENVKKTVNGVTKTLAHKTEERDKIEPTKDKPGHQAGTFCVNCERYITGGEEIPYEHTEHVWVGEPVPDGSMSAMITYCTVCGEIYTPLDPQNWIITEGRDCTKVYYEFEGEKHYAKHAELVTETEPGYTEGKKCPSCGMWLSGHEVAEPVGPKAIKIRVNDMALLMATAADEDFVDIVEAGTTFDTTEELTNGYYKVTHNGQTCYIHQSYCDVVG